MTLSRAEKRWNRYITVLRGARTKGRRLNAAVDLLRAAFARAPASRVKTLIETLEELAQKEGDRNDNE